MDRTVTAVGQGEASGTPDSMRLHTAVVAQAEEVADALAQAAQGMRALGEVARRFTSAERITSTGLHIWSRTDHEGRPQGFEVRHAVTVHCAGFDTAGQLVSALGAELGNALNIDGIEPAITEPGDLAVLARARAWREAAAKAEELARLADAQLGHVLHIDETAAAPGPIGGFKEAALDATRFEVGSQSVLATLRVTWALTS